MNNCRLEGLALIATVFVGLVTPNHSFLVCQGVYIYMYYLPGYGEACGFAGPEESVDLTKKVLLMVRYGWKIYCRGEYEPYFWQSNLSCMCYFTPVRNPVTNPDWNRAKSMKREREGA